jgi:AraC-like DNA-binding protein
MKTIRHRRPLSYFKEDLWSGGAVARSPEMTPLYMERYRSPRCNTVFSSHEHWEFSVHISGCGMLITDVDLQIIPEIIFLIPPGIEHRESSRQDLDSIWMGFRGDLPGVARDRVMSVKAPELIKQFIECWMFSARNHGAIGPELDGRLKMVTGHFFRELASRNDLTPMQRAVEYFNENYQQPVSMQELARRLNCSEGHFYRQFKEFTGETPVRYLNTIRLKNASFHLCHSRLTVKQIARLCGFPDPYYFSRVFKQAHGLSPVNYRDVMNRSSTDMA